MDRHRQWVEDCFRTFFRSLTYFAYTYLQDARMAEDVVQNSFLRVLDGSAEFKNEEHLKHYLYKTVRNGCINELGRQSHYVGLSGERTGDPAADDLFHGIVRAEIYGKIIDAIDRLPGECRKVFWLSHIEQLDNQEVAERLSISVNTVKVQKNRAKQRLREILKDLYPLIGLVMAGRMLS